MCYFFHSYKDHDQRTAGENELPDDARAVFSP